MPSPTHVIYKYPLQVTDVQQFPVPDGSRPLSVQVQRGVPCLWCLVPTGTVNKTTMTVRTYGTGHNLALDHEGEQLHFLGTYQIHAGALVFHVFTNYPKD